MVTMVASDDYKYSFDDLARDLDTPATTLRRYFKLFKIFIPSKTIKRATKFNKEARQVFEDITDMYKQRCSTEEIMSTIAANRMPTHDVRPSAPAQAMDLKSSAPAIPDMMAQLIPLAERFLTAYEAQTKALQDIASALAQNRAQDAPKASGDINPHPDHQTGQEGADIKPARTRDEIIAEVHRLRGLGWGAGRIRTAMVKAGWGSLAGVGHQLSKSTVARIVKGDIK